MPQTFTTRDVELLGYATAKVRKNSTAYTIIDATAIAGVERVNAQFLYLKTRCSSADLRIAAAELDTKTSTHVVAPPSLPISNHDIGRSVGPVASISSQKDLIWEKLGTIFNHYRTSLSDLPVEEHFVSPRAVDEDVGDTLVERLVNYMSGRNRAEDRQLLVLSAHAGVGKTTVARYLTQQLNNRASSYKTLPLYIEAEHWRKLDLTRVDHLWDVFFTSLRETAPDLTLSESLLRHALQQGYVSFVFDGFDELCAHDSFDPVEVLHELAEIAAESEARILLTTRTLFWDARLTSVPENTRVWRMDSFNVQQAKGYFRKRFGEQSQRNADALSLYNQLRDESVPRQHQGSVRAQFINLPLCVRMIADLVLAGGVEVGSTQETSVIQRVLRAICRREIARQGLVTSEDSQLSALQDVAVTYHDETNPEFGIEDLFLSANGFSHLDQEKLVDHALLVAATQSADTSRYQFRYDFLGPHLRAVAVANWVLYDRLDAIPTQETLSIMEGEADGKGHVLEQLSNSLSLEHIGFVTGRIQYIPARRQRAASFLFHVGQALTAGLKDKTDRTRYLFGETVQGKSRHVVKQWKFCGLIERLDLTGVQFASCRFVDVMFKNCVSDGTTVFSSCTFEGDLRFDKERAFSRVVLEECQERYPADVAWARVLNREGGDYSDSVDEILRIALRKFWRNGRVKRTLRKADWKKGGLGRFGEAKRVLDVMLGAGLVRDIHISGAEEGGIAFDDASIPDLQNYMDNQQLSGKIAAVQKALLESMKR